MAEKDPLYAIAYEVYNRKGDIVRTGIEYVHAADSSLARHHFCRSRPNRRRFRIIRNGIAPVVGYWVDNEKTEKLLSV